MGQLTRFVTRYGTYTFPTIPGDQEYQDNFADLANNTTRIPFMDGGFDELGDDRGLSEIGSIQFGIVLRSSTREGMQVLRDDLKKIAEWGFGRLYFQPTDLGMAERWCWCRIKNISIPERRDLNTDIWQRIKLSFHAPTPFWYGPGNCGTIWGGGWKWGDGTKWGGGTPAAVSGILTNTTITASGNAYTYLNVNIRPKTSPVQSVIDPIVRRIVDGQVVDEVRFIGQLNAGDNLFINTAKREVHLNGEKVYDNRFISSGRDWLMLRPGLNNIQIKFGLSTDAAEVNLRYLDRWT